MTRATGALVGLAWSLVAVHAAHAEKFAVSTGPFIVQCTSAGQVCDPPATLPIGDPTRKLKLKKFVYQAASAHCSAGRLLIELDGALIGRMRFVAGSESATLKKRIRLQPGQHALAFRFEGRPGGCNTGYVASWGGDITVQGRRPS